MEINRQPERLPFGEGLGCQCVVAACRGTFGGSRIADLSFGFWGFKTLKLCQQTGNEGSLWSNESYEVSV